MTDLAALWSANAVRWVDAKLTREKDFHAPAVKAVANKQTYREVEAHTGVPWAFTALTHYRETSQDFSRSIAQGVNAVLVFPKSAEVKLPSLAGVVISR